MVKHLPLPTDNVVYVDNMRVRSIIKLLQADPTTDVQAKFLYGTSTTNQRDEFLYEAAALQHFADQAYETVY